jgi:predicted amidohydrolase
MQISALAYSVSTTPPSLEQWQTRLLGLISNEVNAGSNVIVFPELFLVETSSFFRGSLNDQLYGIAEYCRLTLFPAINELMLSFDHSDELFLCMGSGPWIKNDHLMNSAAVWQKGLWFFQDKLHLTPWEVDFTPGNEVLIFEHLDLKLAVVICYDSEHPGLSLTLKQEGVDLVILPYATTNQNGVGRVTRCASARAVELGAAVVAVPLLGDTNCPLIDHHEGRIGFYLPAQEAAPADQQIVHSSYSTGEALHERFELELEMMRKLRVLDLETKPYLKKDHPDLVIQYATTPVDEPIYAGIDGDFS